MKLTERREALFFLSHFVGDIHQPLHVSHAEDRGGNAIPVNFLGQETNLHSVWDTKLLIAVGFRSNSGVARLLKIKPIQKRNWGTYDVAVWANDALFKSRTFAYRNEHGRKIKTMTNSEEVTFAEGRR